jgi:hypothetical protein
MYMHMYAYKYIHARILHRRQWSYSAFFAILSSCRVHNVHTHTHTHTYIHTYRTDDSGIIPLLSSILSTCRVFRLRKNVACRDWWIMRRARTLECIIIETRADSVQFILTSSGPFVSRHVHNDVKKTSWMHNRCKNRPQNVWFDQNGICSSLNNYAFQSANIAHTE